MGENIQRIVQIGAYIRIMTQIGVYVQRINRLTATALGIANSSTSSSDSL
jgi:hypothetical protein